MPDHKSEVITKEETSSYEPDYDNKCDNCGQSPVVTVVVNGKLSHEFEMCGPCTFGSAKCIDPDEW